MHQPQACRRVLPFAPLCNTSRSLAGITKRFKFTALKQAPAGAGAAGSGGRSKAELKAAAAGAARKGERRERLGLCGWQVDTLLLGDVAMLPPPPRDLSRPPPPEPPAPHSLTQVQPLPRW